MRIARVMAGGGFEMRSGGLVGVAAIRRQGGGASMGSRSNGTRVGGGVLALG